MRFATKALRVAQTPEGTYRPVVPPLVQSTTYAWNNLDEIPEIDYTRCQNPNRKILEEVLASMENGLRCTLFSSGMAAISATFSLLQQGDHLILANDIYGGTFRLAEKYLPRQGVSFSSFDAQNPSSLEDVIQPNTKLLIFESPTNPTLRVPDIRAITEIAKKHGIITVFDNTFASPANQTPLDLGVDIVVHSTTKYISGHSDVVGGATITNNAEIGEWIYEWNKAIGANPSPFDCWLSIRGLRTLACRIDRHNQNAQAVAEFLATQPAVKRVHYPGLPDHPDHEVAKSQMRGFGGMVSFELETEAAARAVAESTRIFLLAESLGGVESLVAYPPLMSHATMTEEQRLERGIPPTMLRLSVGVEDIEDLLEDLQHALAQIPVQQAILR
ncbi:MAG: PLP-dependent transferase [Armatimonadetes bacterium]|nr:PLP-dependent transferase [Armatimonadota bacterium]